MLMQAVLFTQIRASLFGPSNTILNFAGDIYVENLGKNDLTSLPMSIPPLLHTSPAREKKTQGDSGTSD